jgi:hypothetical protein
MTVLSDKAIKDFQIAFEKDFGRKIDKEMAQRLGIELLKFMALIYRPITKEENLKI